MNKTSDDSAREKRNAYMREWNAKNREKVRKYGIESRLALKITPDTYLEFREKNNVSNRKYASKNREKLRAKALLRNHALYSPEYGKMIRNRYGVKYATQVSMKSARKRAVEKELPFDLTPEWYDAEFEKGCAVTGIQLDPNGSKTPFTAHVDKVIPALGYVMSNCRLVCACYNLAKKNWTDADVLRMAKALVSRNADE